MGFSFSFASGFCSKSNIRTKWDGNFFFFFLYFFKSLSNYSNALILNTILNYTLVEQTQFQKWRERERETYK